MDLSFQSAALIACLAYAVLYRASSAQSSVALVFRRCSVNGYNCVLHNGDTGVLYVPNRSRRSSKVFVCNRISNISGALFRREHNRVFEMKPAI